MKSWKTAKVACAVFGGIGLMSALGIGISSIVSSTHSPTHQEAQTSKLIKNQSIESLIAQNVEDTRLITLATNKQFSTINGQEIVNAIESFQTNNSLLNTDNAFLFNCYDQSNFEASLIKDIKENIKYYSNNKNDYNLYTLPSNAISINQDPKSFVYNVNIDLSLVNGFVNYYAYFNPGLYDQEQVDYTNNQLISQSNTLNFNAMANNQVVLKPKQDTTLNIVYLTAIIVGGVGLLLIILLVILKKQAKIKKIRVGY